MKNVKIYAFLGLITLLMIAVAVKFVVNGSFTFADEEGMQKDTIVVNSDTRVFYVHVPPNYHKQKDKKYPVVLIYHGTVADANKIKNYTKFNDFADKNDIIAVYPEYMGNWDWDLKPAEKSKDIVFTEKLIEYLTLYYKADSKKIYATGYSSGAEMSYLLACTLPNKIAAFAPVSGNMRQSYVAGCHINKSAPILLVHGTSDPYEKWNGDSRKEMISVDEVLNFWKGRNKCSGEEKQTVFPHKNSEKSSTTAKLFVNNDCADKSEVSILKIEGGGHTWPGSPTSPRIETFLGKTNYDVSANDLIWEFFSRHKLN